MVKKYALMTDTIEVTRWFLVPLDPAELNADETLEENAICLLMDEPAETYLLDEQDDATGPYAAVSIDDLPLSVSVEIAKRGIDEDDILTPEEMEELPC